MSNSAAAALLNANPQRQGPRFVFIGFNAAIDRYSISKLLGVVGIIMEKRPRPGAIVLCMSSDGGAMESAFYGYEILRSLPCGVITHNLGLVASAANILFMAGELRFASPKTSFLFHDTRFTISTPSVMTQDELRLTTTSIRGSDIKTADIIAERINQPAAKVKRWFGEKLRTAEFAMQHGIISKIQPMAVGDEDEFVQVTF